MLSIIISSYQPDYFSALEKNIAETCGIPYEIIKIDNPGLMAIFEADNKGAEKAIYDNLLFLHEDVEFETRDWGSILIDYFKNTKTGVVGVAGNNYIPNCPFAWWDSFENNIVHINQYLGQKFYRGSSIEHDKKVYCLDGVFLACTKKVYGEFLFDERINGFHGYDLNFSARVSGKYENWVTSKIMIRHYSGGTADKEWFLNMIKYRKTFTKPNSQKIDKKKEAFFFSKYMDYLDAFQFSKTEKRKYLRPYISPKFIGRKLAIKTFLDYYLK